MARIRSIKPDAFTSDSLSRVDYFTRWLFAGLWTYLDDEGYGRDDVRLIKAAIFPLDVDATPKKVGAAVSRLVTEGCLCRFSVGGRPFLHAPNWPEHQKVNRPTPSKFPVCPDHGPATHGGLSEDSVRTHGRKGKEQGTGNREAKHDVSDGALTESFDEFWTLYPKKTAKEAARKAWRAACKRASPEVITTGLRAQLPAMEKLVKPDGDYRKNPATWLNGGCWDDQVTAPANSARGEWWAQ